MRPTSALLLSALLVAGCSTGAPAPPPPPAASPAQPSPAASTAPGSWTLPPAGAPFDYQLGGPYPPAPGVRVVARDRTAPPAGLGYDVCYVNGFQTQPEDSAAFARDHPDLLVRTGDGPLVDPGWPDEFLFDTSTPQRRAALAALVAPQVQECAAAGYDAVEFDNLDSATRSRGRLDLADNVVLAEEYARLAHGAGLAAAQKNTVEVAGRLRAAGYDFAVTESCLAFDECGGFLAHYPVVLDVEYVDELGEDGFAAACASGGPLPTLVLRDHDLVTPADRGYARRTCAG